MAKDSVQKCEYLAPQFFDFDATEASFNDDYFNRRVSLWSQENIKINEETAELSGNNEKIDSKTENLKTPSNPAIENIKKGYRVPLTKTPSSPAVNTQSPNNESPELEYTRPWLNKTCSSLISAMDGLKLSSENSKLSLTPINTRNFNLPIETSTPFITVKERSETRFLETRINDPQTPECCEVQSTEIITRLELQEAEKPEIIVLGESVQDVDVKTAKLDENNEEESEDNNLQHAKAAGHSSDQIVPTTAMNGSNNEENTQVEIISEKSGPDFTKQVTEKFSNDLAKNTDNLDENLSDLDEHFEDAEAELSKLESHVDATEQKEENGKRTKTRKAGVLVNKARRQSQKFRRQSGKYVSMAEAILKFQKGTPKRFYSTKRIMKSGPLKAVAQSSRKLTYATSPVLLCKSRCRRTIASNQQEKETTEKNTAKRIGTSKKITQTAPLNLDTRKNDKRDKIANSKTQTTKNPAEKIPATVTKFTKVKTITEEPQKMMKTKSEAMPMKSTSLTTKTKSFSGLTNARTKSSSELIPKTAKKTGATTSKTDAHKSAPGAIKKIQTKTNAKSTCALSFEERNKLLLKKREEFAKRMIEQEKQARVFHARPAPTFKPVTVHGSSSENLKIEHNHRNVKSPRTGNSSRGLENRKNMPPSKTAHGSSMENLKIEHNHQNVKSPKTGNSSHGLENQENMPPSKTVHDLSMENLNIEHSQQNLKSPRTGNSSHGFENQENMPPSKTVHGSSMENLKIEHNQQNLKSPRTGNSSHGFENQENMPPSKTVHGSSMENLRIEHNQQNLKTPTTENASCALRNQENMPVLNTQEKCKKRRLFDAQIKKKEEEAESRRKEEEIERLATMKNQEKELRKRLELKAKPMPTFKNPQVAKSKKPLTDPQSPAWSRKAKK